MNDIGGIHHVTHFWRPIKKSDFTPARWLRMVKKTWNQDSHGHVHLFYADADGHSRRRPDVLPWPDAGGEARFDWHESSLAVPKGR